MHFVLNDSSFLVLEHEDRRVFFFVTLSYTSDSRKFITKQALLFQELYYAAR